MSTNFLFKHSKIFALLNTAKKQGVIDDNEKNTIKEFFIDKEPDLTLELEEYDQDQDLNKLMDSIKLICSITDLSSPVDNGLMARKKRTQKFVKKQKSFHEEIEVENCDLGCSPVIDFSKKKLTL